MLRYTFPMAKMLAIIFCTGAYLVYSQPVFASYAAPNPAEVQESTVALGSEPTMSMPTGTYTNTLFLPVISWPAWLYLPIYTQQTPLHTPSPPQGTDPQSLNAPLVWDYDKKIDDPAFTVYLNEGEAFPDQILVENLENRWFDPYTFEPDTTYSWRVVATDADGKEYIGPVWTFHTDSFPFPPAIGSMVSVPASEFLMGCHPGHSGYTCLFNQIPLHAVYLDSYEIDKFEITNIEYRACVHSGVCEPPLWNGSPGIGDHYFDNDEYNFHPVMFVSKWDAEDYCSWVDKRLPTEAEWEKAARGSLDTRPWPWGDEDWDCSRVNRCSGAPAQVDDYYTNQSPYGAVNMSGNVFEWTQDFFNDLYYYWSPYDNPINTVQHQETPYFSIRGGSYHDNWWYARVNHRSGGHRGAEDNYYEDKPGDDYPKFRTFRVGFRCARSLP